MGEAKGNEARLLGNRSRFHFIATKLRSVLSFDNCTGARTTRDTSSAVNISLKPAYPPRPLLMSLPMTLAALCLFNASDKARARGRFP